MDRSDAEPRALFDGSLEQVEFNRSVSVQAGMSSTDNFMRQAISTPTAYGTTALSSASTPPIGKP